MIIIEGLLVTLMVPVTVVYYVVLTPFLIYDYIRANINIQPMKARDKT